MNIVGKEILQEFWQKNKDAENSLKTWVQIIEQAEFRHIFELKQTFRYADAVGKSCVAFNIRGNHYRLITKINYAAQVVLVLYVLTHNQYDAQSWKKKDCN